MTHSRGQALHGNQGTSKPSAPSVSVVIPAYNNQRYLGDTLRSVLAQTYDDFEVVIADHSSTDGTIEFLNSSHADAKVRILAATPEGGGAVANWNRVSREATGTWLKLVCGDDLIDPEALEKQMGAVSENPSAVLVASRRRIVGLPWTSSHRSTRTGRSRRVGKWARRDSCDGQGGIQHLR